MAGPDRGRDYGRAVPVFVGADFRQSLPELRGEWAGALESIAR